MHQTSELSLIVARGRNGVIGMAGGIPWRLPADQAFFKRVTLGKPIIMGRNTWESFPRRPLPGRDNIVLTRDWTYAAEGARVYSSFAPAVSAARAIAARAGKDEVFVIGGQAIYERALPIADKLYITEVDAAPDGDAFFPDFDPAEWTETHTEPFEADEKNDHAFTIRIFAKVR